MRIHLIAIGGSAMHNIAIALHKKKYIITGSDDKIRNPSKARLKKYNLLPKKEGWFPYKISPKIDAIILGMHAREDNPELKKAIQLKIPIYSYPEYVYKQCQNKKRIVIGGSHGKTSITSMIIHVLQKLKIACDYLVGAQLKGFESMVKLTDDAKFIIIEGDEYLSSIIDKRPKFHLYQPHIGVISGIAWDHVNVFPTFDIYKEQFRIFKNIVKQTLIYYKDDKELSSLMHEPIDCKIIPYSTPKYSIKNGVTCIKNKKLQIFGNHNMQNLNAARLVCNELGVSDKIFFEKISSFSGAENRLELILKNKKSCIYKDFAHSPSKLKATISAMKKQFFHQKLVACMELHTFSSLNKIFLKEYNGSMREADIAIVYFNPNSFKQKKIKLISKEDVQNAFGQKNLLVFMNSKKLESHLKSMNWNNKNLLMMSSGNFNNIDLKKLQDSN